MYKNLDKYWTETFLQLSMALPLAVSFLAEMAMNITNNLIIARLGSLELAALGISGGLLFGFLYICLNLVSMVNVKVAEAYGRDDHESMAHITRQGLVLSLLIAIPSIILGWHMDKVLIFFGQKSDVALLGKSYMQSAVWVFIPYMWFFILRGLVVTLNKGRIVLFITLIAIGLNFIANYMLVYGKWGMPMMGVSGSGLATTLICWGMFIALGLYIYVSKNFKHYYVFQNLKKIDWPLCWDLFYLGLPVAGMILVEMGIFYAVALTMGYIGTNELAATQIVMNYMTTIFMIPIAFTHMVSIRVATNLATKSFNEIKLSATLALIFVGSFMLIAAFITYCYAANIPLLYLDPLKGDQVKVIELAASFLAVCAIFQFFDGLQVVAGGCLRGLKDTKIPFLAASFGYWVIGFPLGWVLCFWLGYGSLGIWWGLAAGLFITSLLLVYRFYHKVFLMEKSNFNL
ncbi:MAG: MATE family efflux transporter [Alphaproteobacteria bacterium]|nr:MATE family efflux transporter [Alphaproteobacteria bacterium]